MTHGNGRRSFDDKLTSFTRLGVAVTNAACTNMLLSMSTSKNSFETPALHYAVFLNNAPLPNIAHRYATMQDRYINHCADRTSVMVIVTNKKYIMRR